MAFRLASWLRPMMLRALLFDVRLAARLLREPAVPVVTKAVMPLALMYLISPIDVLPDFIPVIGQLDDLALVYVALKLFLRVCPPAAVAFHHAAALARRPFTAMSPAATVIDAEFRRN